MGSKLAPGCLTRVVVDNCEIEVAELSAVMQRIQSALPDVPAAQREYLAHALFDLAVPYTVAFNREVGATAS